jgi:hypothetical protein
MSLEDELCRIESIVNFDFIEGVGKSPLPSVSVTVNKEDDIEKIKHLFRKYSIGYYSILLIK